MKVSPAELDENHRQLAGFVAPLLEAELSSGN
jgi:hypothetical protein